MDIVKLAKKDPDQRGLRLLEVGREELREGITVTVKCCKGVPIRLVREKPLDLIMYRSSVKEGWVASVWREGWFLERGGQNIFLS